MPITKLVRFESLDGKFRVQKFSNEPRLFQDYKLGCFLEASTLGFVYNDDLTFEVPLTFGSNFD